MAAPVLVLASRSAGKLRELRALCEVAGFAADDLASLGIAEDEAEDALEVHATFEENALAKARWFAERLPGRAIIADDSGLEVAVLGGAPGVRSKRWAGHVGTLEGAALDVANAAALVRELRGRDDRRARYVCAAVCVRDADSWSARGEVSGRILDAPRGAGGFGYDPWFLSDELGRTFAEVSGEEKAGVSHRARAMSALLRTLARDLPLTAR